jgi:FkbM family methyltransferase
MSQAIHRNTTGYNPSFMPLPYRVDRALSRAALALGSKHRTMRRDGLSFTVRRLSFDEHFVVNVVEQREYLQHGLTISRGDTVIDIGGNIGTFAVLAASMGAQVISLEPSPDNLALLRANLYLNHMSPKVTVMPVGIAGCSGRLQLHQASAGGGFHTIHREAFNREFVSTITIDAVTLADIFEQNEIGRCDFLKLDCEGAEFEAIAACPLEMLGRVRQVAMEYHAEGNDPRVASMIERLTAAGLSLVHHNVFPSYHRGGHLFLRRH